MRLLHLTGIFQIALAAPAQPERRAGPTVIAPSPQATVVGRSILGVDTFNGIPYAQPPVGSLRLRPPQPLTSPVGTVDGTASPRSCPQFTFSVDPSSFPTSVIGTLLNSPLFQAITNAGEDCLTVNVQRPAGVAANAKLPVLFWIFGGGFELGSTSTYDGTSLLLESVAKGKPFIFVAINYRVGGFGFLPGKEVLADGASNLGLLDQRLGLQWVADNIAAFGGDPDKVTIWGESAGAISVMDQMLLFDGDNQYKGKSLFRGGIMNSGSIVPAQRVDSAKAQAVYDKVVQAAGCAGSADALACLRQIPYTRFLNAANSVPGILSYRTVDLSYLPRPDGRIITDSPEALVAAGKYTKVPFIVGDQEDEGTLFALFTPNITTIADVRNYFASYFAGQVSFAQIDSLVATYQTITEDGSPFRTGLLNNYYPQFKRVSAIIGDITFTLTRRLFLETSSAVYPDVPSWSYLAAYDYGTPILGTTHASDLLQVFYGVLPNGASSSIRSYYYSFIYDLDPNKDNGGLPTWPRWSVSKQLIHFGALSNSFITDNFREDSANVLRSLFSALRI